MRDIKFRDFNSLQELKTTHQKEVNEFPFIFVFAFSDKEFISKMAEEIKKRKPACTGITTMEGIAKHVIGIGAGGYIFKEDASAMREMFERHKAERKHFNKTEKNLVATILDEMNSHEYGYTRDPYDTLLALEKTQKDLETDEKFARCWKKAEKKCFKEIEVLKMKKQFCPYCGQPLTEKCGCERIAAEEYEQWLEDYYNDPEVQAGWRNQDLCEMRRREQ